MISDFPMRTLTIAWLMAVAVLPGRGELTDYETVVRPLLERYCYDLSLIHI